MSYKDLFLRELDRIVKESGKPTQPIIIALDNDAAGNKCAEDLSAELSKRGLTSYRRNPCGEYKDANEALIMNRETLAAEVQRAEGIAEEAAEEIEGLLADGTEEGAEDTADDAAEEEPAA